MSIVEAEHPAGVPVSVSVEIGGKEISFETGKMAKQADGAVIVRSGETVVLGTAQGRTEAREGADFFPLTVDVEERMYAAGKIPGGFFKREGRPTERAILTAGDDPELRKRYDGEFHQALISSCGSRELMQTHAVVFDKYFRYQMVAFSYRGSEPAAQHRTLLDSALKRDAETATATLRAHVHNCVEHALATAALR